MKTVVVEILLRHLGPCCSSVGLFLPSKAVPGDSCLKGFIVSGEEREMLAFCKATDTHTKVWVWLWCLEYILPKAVASQ